MANLILRIAAAIGEPKQIFMVRKSPDQAGAWQVVQLPNPVGPAHERAQRVAFTGSEAECHKAAAGLQSQVAAVQALVAMREPGERFFERVFTGLSVFEKGLLWRSLLDAELAAATAEAEAVELQRARRAKIGLAGSR